MLWASQFDVRGLRHAKDQDGNGVGAGGEERDGDSRTVGVTHSWTCPVITKARRRSKGEIYSCARTAIHDSRQAAISRQTTTRCARCRPCIRSRILLPVPLPDNGSIIFPLYLTASNAGKSKCELGLHFERPLHRRRRHIASLTLSLSLWLSSTSSFRTCRTIFRP